MTNKYNKTVQHRGEEESGCNRVYIVLRCKNMVVVVQNIITRDASPYRTTIHTFKLRSWSYLHKRGNYSCIICDVINTGLTILYNFIVPVSGLRSSYSQTYCDLF